MHRLGLTRYTCCKLFKKCPSSCFTPSISQTFHNHIAEHDSNSPTHGLTISNPGSLCNLHALMVGNPQSVKTLTRALLMLVRRYQSTWSEHCCKGAYHRGQNDYRRLSSFRAKLANM
eukprot:2246655-Amphidinium_carterae.1